jgi:1-acyl-sn-glycerol-3-phosphate acyltransferase
MTTMTGSDRDGRVRDERLSATAVASVAVRERPRATRSAVRERTASREGGGSADRGRAAAGKPAPNLGDKDGLRGPDRRVMAVERHLWNFLCDHYFRLEVGGWQRLPDEPSLLVGVHSGGALTMDAWTFVSEWYRRFGERRILHGTAHDVLMAAPGLGHYFRANGVLPASREGVTRALAAGHDVIVWPGGEQDAMRNWRKRDRAVLAGRRGFVKQAISSGVPIVPVASVGGHDTVFILSEGRFLARWSGGLGKRLRGVTLPITLGLPLGVSLEILPTHIPLPAKIRTELLDPIHVDTDAERADDPQYVDSVYREVEAAIQAGMDRLAARRSFPILG